ncbi:MAG: undecaprenyldiphospho-muramoylpentapeptide beta-N-acetylglucosaminyltransferase [Clostridiales Family XIII bacterium]|jgi:UDP-N-acetylglucosamine--N-acetylmuramyl-(pentapeptide) pyrophosphoryl-undecaprenol N-acetylglucosamine transferase|nr:undecaprenyldiphospho-muramoylpentapeptide beta-N-acetylglucosaminyltransferase [Clostridiales Family XIII bacterium]
MRALLAGGGTGGHIYPAIAIADKIARRQPGSEILFIGGENGREKRLVPESGYPIRLIKIRGFNRKDMLKNVGAVADLLKAGAEIRRILKEFRPDVVIGTGGYVSGPVVREAGRMGIRAFIHEQNAFPGVANKMAERYAEKVFIAFEEGGKYFKEKHKLVVTGNPVRKEFVTAGIRGCREKLGIGAGVFVLLCFGGSIGAGAINAAMAPILKELQKEAGMRVYFITGERYYSGIAEGLEGSGIEAGGNISVMAYSDNIYEYMSAADLVVCRSGALTVSEVAVCGKAAIMIPSPNVTGDHQLYNAKTISGRGGAILLEEKDLGPEKLLDLILRLKNNKRVVNEMGEASRKLGRADAADAIYAHIVSGGHYEG